MLHLRYPHLQATLCIVEGYIIFQTYFNNETDWLNHCNFSSLSTTLALDLKQKKTDLPSHAAPGRRGLDNKKSTWQTFEFRPHEFQFVRIKSMPVTQSKIQIQNCWVTHAQSSNLKPRRQVYQETYNWKLKYLHHLSWGCIWIYSNPTKVLMRC